MSWTDGGRVFQFSDFCGYRCSTQIPDHVKFRALGLKSFVSGAIEILKESGRYKEGKKVNHRRFDFLGSLGPASSFCASVSVENGK